MSGAGRISLKRRWRRLRLGLWNRVVFGPSPLVRLLLRPCSALTRAGPLAGFDRDFYLGQIEPGPSRVAASRDARLHYQWVGRSRGLSPEPGFDPLFYRRETPGLQRGQDPYAHYGRRGRAQGRPANAVAARASGPAAAPGPLGVALAINHGRGGGSSKYLGLHLLALARRGYGVIEAVRAPGPRPVFSFATDCALSWFDLELDQEALIEFARARGVTRLVINHLIDLPERLAEQIPDLARRMGADYELLLHDYYLACPRVDLVDSAGRYCGLAEPSRCRTCLAASEPGLAGLDPEAWRANHAALLAGAARVTAPSLDLARRLAPVFPDLCAEVVEPEDDSTLPERKITPLGPDGILTVAIFGGLNRPKGYDVILALARVLARDRAPVRLLVFGEALDASALARLGVGVTGRYRENQIDRLIEAGNPQLFLVPAIWPETWCFSLSIALRRAAPVMAFDIGAVADRLRRLGRDGILPYGLSQDPEALAATLMRYRQALI